MFFFRNSGTILGIGYSYILQKISKSNKLIGKRLLGLKNHKSLVVLEKFILIKLFVLQIGRKKLHFFTF